MYLDITAASYDANRDEAIIEGIDLDNVLLNSWNQEFHDNAEVTMRFDLKTKGARIYLYKLLKSQVKAECKTLEEMLLGLVGKITNISANFMVTGE